MKFQDLTGMRFGRLVVVKRAENNKQNRVMWECICDCGKTTHPIMAKSLKSGNTQSCGCFHEEQQRKLKTVHGKYGTRLYRIWGGMLTRCTNPKHKDFKHYGGRGITVCAEWKQFDKFYEWAIANGYQENLTVDRKDVNGNYCPENCRWATQYEQVHNRRSSTTLEGTKNGDN